MVLQVNPTLEGLVDYSFSDKNEFGEDYVFFQFTLTLEVSRRLCKWINSAVEISSKSMEEELNRLLED